MDISTRTENGDVVLCGSSIYTQKFYLNNEFEKLPEDVKDELHAMCGAFTQEVGGIFMLVFDKAGNLQIQTRALEDDILFDEIGCGLKVKQIQSSKRELFQKLELFFKIFIQGVDVNSLV
jgi:hypothetical protein